MARWSRERSRTVRDVHVYFNRPAEEEGADLDDLKEVLTNLEHVSEVMFDPSGNVVAVSFEGGQAEQEAIERAVEEAGYEVSRLSVRTTFAEGPNLWDI
jgi:copper chaperone CopZ